MHAPILTATAMHGALIYIGAGIAILLVITFLRGTR